MTNWRAPLAFLLLAATLGLTAPSAAAQPAAPDPDFLPEAQPDPRPQSLPQFPPNPPATRRRCAGPGSTPCSRASP